MSPMRKSGTVRRRSACPGSVLSGTLSMLLLGACVATTTPSDTAPPVAAATDDRGAPVSAVPVAESEGFAVVLTRVAQTATEYGDYGTAYRLYARAHELEPERFEPALGLARALARLKRYNDAETAFLKALSVQPEQPDALEGLGNVLLAQNKPKAAIPHLQAAISERETPRALELLATAYDMTGQPHMADVVYERGLAIAPTDISLRAGHGLSLSLNGRLEEGIAEIDGLADQRVASRKDRLRIALVYLLAGRDAAIEGDAAGDTTTPTADSERSELRELYHRAVAGDRGFLHSMRFASPRRMVEAKQESTPQADVDTPANTSNPPTPPPQAYSAPPPSQVETTPPLTQADSSPAPLDLAIVSRPAPRPPQKAESTQAVFEVQLAAYRTIKRAEKGWLQLRKLAPGVLGSIDHVIRSPSSSNVRGRLHRLRTHAFDVRADAVALCDELKEKRLDCLVVRTKRLMTIDPVPTTDVSLQTGFVEPENTDPKPAAQPVEPKSTYLEQKAIEKDGMGDPPAQSESSKRFRLQLAAYHRPDRAALGWIVLQRIAPTLLGDLSSVIREPNRHAKGSAYYLLQAGDFERREEAAARCLALARRGIECHVITDRDEQQSADESRSTEHNPVAP